MGKNQALARAVFLDRDGVINRARVRGGRPYAPVSFEEFEILPGVREAIRLLHEAGFKLIVVTNQPDAAKDARAMEFARELHQRLYAAFPLDGIKTCFHVEEDECVCRKPKPGMLIDAAHEWALDLKKSYLVGDRWKDMEAGKAAGCRTILVHWIEYTENNAASADVVVGSLLEAAQVILEESRDEN